MELIPFKHKSSKMKVHEKTKKEKIEKMRTSSVR